MKRLLLLFCCLLLQNATAQELSVKATIKQFFNGLHNGDTVAIKKAVNNNLKLQTIFKNKEGKSIVSTQSKEGFLKAIASKKPSDIWFEKLESYQINIDGDLASVWTPYTFYLNNKISHCGTNSFQLFNNNGKWEIIYIVDTRRKTPCNNN